MKNRNKSGRIEYLKRAFHQDAYDAMRGNIIHGIIELVTNSDDAYVDITNGARQKKIVIEVEHKRGTPWKVIVRDRATGMSANELEEKITKLGNRTSGFELGANKRGNLGRGAKDVTAFGNVEFISIHNNKYSKLALKKDGSWKSNERDAKQEDRKYLGIPKDNGTVVIISAESTIRCPRHKNLYKDLVTHFQLRDILSDPTRRVELLNLNSNSRKALKYEHPDLPIVFDQEIEIPDYPEAKAHLTIYRNDQCYEIGAHESGRPSGILIKGTRAIYENTLFSFENQEYSGWFSGFIRCEYIDSLARKFDDSLENEIIQDPLNPIQIISRRRDGLVSEHPFYINLRKAVEIPLGDLIKLEAENAEKESKTEESESLRRDLSKLASEVGKLINEELKDIEADLLPYGSADTADIAIIPEQVYAYIGENRTLTVIVKNNLANEGDEVSIKFLPEGVVELNSEVILSQHPRRIDLLAGQIRVKPILEGEITIITASIGRYDADAMLEVKPPRTLIEEEVEPPDLFIFEKPNYRIGWQREKTIKLVAPASIVADQGENVKISSYSPGLIVRTPTVTLNYDERFDYYIAPVRIEARTLGASSEIRALLGELVATTNI
ncbi:ATP-binding protein, partial [Chloroflexota bacterium]